VRAFLIGCVVLLGVGCAGTSSKAPQEKEQGHTEATKQEQTRSSEATEAEEARCEGTRTTKSPIRGDKAVYTTNDLPGCPQGGLLLGTDKPDKLAGLEGDDKIRGLGAKDEILGGAGNDVIYAGPGDDPFLAGDDGPAAGDDVIYGGPGDEEDIFGGNGEDVLYGGDGSDFLDEKWDRGPDKLYCGENKDEYVADKKDFVSSSCEKKAKMGPAIY
jgi:RTX calcium-binding nonapeptide repeat (4 copies)